MLGGHCCSCFSCQCVQLLCGNTRIQSIDYLQCNWNLFWKRESKDKGNASLRLSSCWTVPKNGLDRKQPVQKKTENNAWKFYRINKIHVQTIAKFLDTRCNLVEMNLLLASICALNTTVQHIRWVNVQWAKSEKNEKNSKKSHLPRLWTNIFGRTILICIFLLFKY